MRIRLSDHFTVKKLLKFTLPSIVMMIFTSIYGVVDGFFVSNFAGQVEFTAVNFIMPFLMMLGAVGFMFGTGGSALVARTLGEGDSRRANEIFSLLVMTALVVGTAISLVGLFFLRPVAVMLGAEGELLSASSWGQRDAYELTVNTTGWQIKELAPVIAAYAEKWFGRAQ